MFDSVEVNIYISETDCNSIHSRKSERDNECIAQNHED